MLEESFVLLPRVQKKTERAIWGQGVQSWNDFVGSTKVRGMSAAKKEHCNGRLQVAKRQLQDENAQFFAGAFPKGEHWRLFERFAQDAVYLDIETTGYYGDVTVVGLYANHETKSFVEGFNLDKRLLEEELKKYKLVVTFNGGSFDLPILKRFFHIDFDVPHVDLRFVCQKVGLCGGLKKIEQDLGIVRRQEVEGLSGQDAVYLWEMWRSTGDRTYLEKLVWYNEEDVINLPIIAKKVIPLLWKKVRNC